MSGILVAIITTLHILGCAALMVAILLQSGKGGGLAGAFGAGTSQTLFGGRGAATFLSRASTVLAVVFFVTSLTLSMTAVRRSSPDRSLIREDARRRATQAPAPTGTTPGAPSAGGAETPTGAGAAPTDAPQAQPDRAPTGGSQ